MDVQEVLEEGYIDGAAAAVQLNRSQGHIRTLCQTGRFPGAFKFGYTWIIPKSSVQMYQPSKRGRRPRREDDTELLRAALAEAKGSGVCQE